MSEFQASLFYRYKEHFFIDGTFFTGLKWGYQVFTFRNQNIQTLQFYTVGYAILINKEMQTYIELFNRVKDFVFHNRENKRFDESFMPSTIHCDFELGFIVGIRQVFPNSEIKLCLWHLYRAIESNKKIIYSGENYKEEQTELLLKKIKTLPYIPVDIVPDVFSLLEEDPLNLSPVDRKFVVDYFKKTYIEKYGISQWNYYKIMDHKTNNACESYHNVLNGKFSKKPSFWKFLYILKDEEEKFKLDFKNVIEGNARAEKYDNKKFAIYKKLLQKCYENYDKIIEEI